ncbi:cbb3-type cytochrome oxidase assembly protein CcoS [Thiomicrospira sp. XS5]|uniref:cbb3-type cytochrome oxidase assembly protein CcoS n=1 Tax=Thiomicrospira sp. XS5 TaxID=1775636 RepID=UPI000B0EFB4D|nr:cbb3-type cytochrome oxidase assembly protein CcoS [Thiomicrospira sp. XS5]
MDVVFGLIPMMLLFGFLVVVVFIWMAKSGQFDDLDGAANSIFMDDEFDEELKKKASDAPDVSDTQQKGSGDGDEIAPQAAEKKPSGDGSATDTTTPHDDPNTQK